MFLGKKIIHFLKIVSSGDNQLFFSLKYCPQGITVPLATYTLLLGFARNSQSCAL